MAEIKNTFLKSKMNKDLDDRILPNGEYRDANNISVGRSEDSDVGALENVIGNTLITATQLNIPGLEIIGIYESSATDKMFVFLTTYTDTNTAEPTFSPSENVHYIYSYDSNNQTYTRLVSGTFLNFSKTNRIVGINLIESLLFWTDDRNQPRKINIELAISAGTPVAGFSESSGPQAAYYTKEHQISVAKYNPYQPIDLYNKIVVTAASGNLAYFTLDGNRVAELTKFIGASVVSTDDPIINGNQYIYVENVHLQGTDTRVVFNSPIPISIAANQRITLIGSTMENKETDTSWPGDPTYLEDRFVRFSYRFKFDDNEYSLMAPFTQIAYVPKQKGYFLSGDEEAAYQSTVVDFMRNNTQNIGLNIPLPDVANRIATSYKISEIEILFRESDAIAVKVLESIPISTVAGEGGNLSQYSYDYQSRKPYKTLPEAQTTRVYDKVPVKAFAQESAGNRIIYGNFTDKYTPPTTIDYNCKISHKSGSGIFNNYIEYPNSSVKRNRNYQMGFVLSDKFGRQSPVILSSVDNGAIVNGAFYSGSTIYSPYDDDPNNTNVKGWFGDAIQMVVNSPIISNVNTLTGTPGLYAIPQQNDSTGIGFATTVSGTNIITGSGNPNNYGSWSFTLNSAFFNLNKNIPAVGEYLRGKYVDFVKVTAITGPTGANGYTVITDGTVNDVYAALLDLPITTPDIKFSYKLNKAGWYSYKVVVKQTQQEYYNAYLPGILNGYPGQSGYDKNPNVSPSEGEAFPGGKANGIFPTNETNLTAHTVLFNDNINKIPRDLTEVGPDQKQYRSAVTLFGRVSNSMDILVTGTGSNEVVKIYGINSQYYAREGNTKTAISHSVSAIANAADLNMSFEDLSPGISSNFVWRSGEEPINGNRVFYQIDTNPLIARISTLEKSIGATNLRKESDQDNAPPLNMLPYLAIYETEPVESLLNIYWESTTSGLISDLNTDVLTGFEGATSFSERNWYLDEIMASDDTVTDFFWPISLEGTALLDTTAILGRVTDGNGVNANDKFELEAGTSGADQGKYRIKIAQNTDFVFIDGSYTADVYTFPIVVTRGDVVTTLYIGGFVNGEGSLTNIAPSFSSVPNQGIALADDIVLSTDAWTGTVNGTGVIDSREEGLVYSYIPDPTNSIDVTNLWTMNPDDGQIEQDPIVISQEGFTNGNYKLTLYLRDASGADGSLVASQDMTVTVGYTQLNILDNVCSLKPTPATLEESNALTTGPTFGANVAPYSGIWYISPSTLDLTDFTDNGILGFGADVDGDYHIEKFHLNADQPGGPTGHTAGTIVFTTNITQPNLSNENDSKFYYKNAQTYWRAVNGTNSDWNPITRVNDYNFTGNPNLNTRAPKSYFLDSNLTGDGGINTSISPVDDGANVAADSWLQIVQASNIFDFGADQSATEIEYAVVLRDLTKINGGNDSSSNPIAWVVVDDLHYPKCVPWQGTNIAIETAIPGEPVIYKTSYKYQTTEYIAGFSSTDTAETITSYAHSPYGEYVSTFYTDISLTTLRTPTDNQYLNFYLHGDEYDPNDKWTNENNGGLEFRWTAGFAYGTSIKLIDPTDLGVSARQFRPKSGSYTDQPDWVEPTEFGVLRMKGYIR